MRALTFAALKEANRRRCEDHFHRIESWSPTDWACALAGEVGEACNLVKKLRRLESHPHFAPGDAKLPLVDMIADELADSMIYLDMLATRLGIDLAAAVCKKFDETSAKMGCTIRLTPQPRLVYPSWEDDPDVMGA